MLGVVYPYVQSRWNELKYSLRSLEMFFSHSEYEVVIIGHKPIWVSDKVKHVAYVDQRQAKRQVNHGEKVRIAVNLYSELLWMNDDIYFLQETDLENLKLNIYIIK